MDEKRLSPDSVIGPMLCNQKKDKTCLVCGDKALGYNFNAVSCESCKAFFRRNAHKTIRGRCEGKCDINVESRSFCKRCRLAKCFTVGMRKDMILDDNQKKLRKQKILINKLRRHGTLPLPPEDTYAVSETDIQNTYSAKIASQSQESLREQFPHLSESEIQTLCCIGKPDSDNKNRKCDLNAKIFKYQPWQDIEESVEEVLSGMGETEKNILLEMNKAHDNSSFLSSTQTKLKNLPKNPTEVFNIADGFVRRIIKVAKQLSYFRSIDKDDQIALLKGSVVEIMMLRSAVNFDIKTETWNLNTTSCIKKPTSSDTASVASSPGSAGSLSEPFDFSAPPSGLDINRLREAAMRGADLNTLRNIARQSSQTESTCSDSSTASLEVSVNTLKQKYGLSIDQMKEKVNSKQAENELDSLRSAAKAAGLDVDALRQAAMSGASFEQLSQMAHSRRSSSASSSSDIPVNLQVKQEVDEPVPTGSSSSISSEILKMGNQETKTMFLTYSKFIRSLMGTIYGDLMILKFLIMLSLFSPDRQGIRNKAVVGNYQEMYANSLKKYLEVRYSEEKNLFARCIMKLTDLRNVNEVHTKMLLKMHVEDIEPLLVEIFDLPQ